MKTLDNIYRAFSLFIQGYIFGSKFGRFEFRRSFWRPWLNSLGGVGAWSLSVLAVIVGGAAFFGAVWSLLWLGYCAGMDM